MPRLVQEPQEEAPAEVEAPVEEAEEEVEVEGRSANPVLWVSGSPGISSSTKTIICLQCMLDCLGSPSREGWVVCDRGPRNLAHTWRAKQIKHFSHETVRGRQMPVLLYTVFPRAGFK